MYDKIETETYVETINRFVVEYHEELPSEQKAQMRLNGIDPDNYWQLKWSFETQEDAKDQCQVDTQWHDNFCNKHGYENNTTFRVRDLGASLEIKRSVVF